MTRPPLGQQPSRLPTADLAAAFGTPQGPHRAAPLAGRLAPVPAPTAPAPPRPGPAIAPTESPAGSDAPHAAHGEGGDVAGQRSLTVIVYLPASLRDRLRAQASSRGATFTDLALEAVDATHGRLDQLLADTRRPTRPGSLFAAPPPRRRLRHSEPQVQVSLRLTRSNLDVLDRLTREHTAPSRSALVSAALGAHLD